MEPLSAYQFGLVARQRTAEAARLARRHRPVDQAPVAVTAQEAAEAPRAASATGSARHVWRLRWHHTSRPRAV